MKRITAFIVLMCMTAASVFAATPILGTNVATAERMYQFVKSQNSSFDREIAEQFIAVSQKYGLRGDIALCQSIIETGWFKYTGGTAVTADDHNYCGLGVTTLGQKGCQFATVKEGVTAQVQHLYAYACSKSLPSGETLVDPRFNYVSRGSAPNWEDLGSGKWAAAAGYGTKIIAMYNDMMAFNVTGDDTPSNPTTASLTASTTSVSLTGTCGGSSTSATVKITGVNLSSDIKYNSSSSAFVVTPQSDWNVRTGGTLKITLDTSKSAATYTGYIAVQSGADTSVRVEINCTGVLSESSTPSNPTAASLTASTTSVSLTGTCGGSSTSASVKITGANLPYDIIYNSSSSAFVVTPQSDWNVRTGGTLKITLDTSKSAATYTGYIAVQSGTDKTIRVEINCSGVLSASGSSTPSTPSTPTVLPNQFTTNWCYSAANGTSTSWMNPANDYTRNMVLKDGKLYVVQRDPDNARSNIHIVDAYTGALKGTLPSTGVVADAYQFASVANMGGTIVACNLAYGATSTLKVYSWSSDTATPSLILETTNHGARAGDLMCASGTINNGKLYFASNTNYPGQIIVYTIVNGQSTGTSVITLKDSSGNAYDLGGGFAVIEVRVLSDGTIWAVGKNGVPALFSSTGTLIRQLSSSAVDGNICGSSYASFDFGNYKLAAAIAYKTTVQQGYLNLIDVTNGEASATKINSFPVLGASGVSNGTFVSTAIAEVENNKIHLWALIPKQGVAKYTATAPAGIDDIVADNSDVTINKLGNVIKVQGGEASEIMLVSMSGAVVARGLGDELVIDSMPKGIYVAVAIMNNGSRVTSKVAL